MKKILIILSIFLFSTANTVFAFDDFEYMSIDEYQKFFELGLTDQPGDDDEDFIEQEQPKPKLKQKYDLNPPDVIKVSDDVIKLNIEKKAHLPGYTKTYEPESIRTSFFKTKRFDLFSDGTKELSDYMTNNLKTTMNASYTFNDKFSIYAGHETWYVNPDASLGSKKLYFNPRLSLTKQCYFDYTSKYNQTTKNIEQEFGLNFKPKVFNDNASFGVKATTVTNENNEIQSKRLKFSTEFYLF